MTSNEQYETTTTAMVAYESHNPGLVSPLVDPSAAKAAIQQYEALKAAIVRPDDVLVMKSRDKNGNVTSRDFLKKAFWRRVATCFGLSLELVSQERGFDEQGHLFYSVMYKAIAPNGRTMDADGYCSTAENGRDKWPEHNVRATAHTRAKNRAISDLVGGGEVSAEEMPDEEARPQQQPRRQAPMPQQQPARAQVYAVPSEPEEPDDEPTEEADTNDTATAYSPVDDAVLTRLLLDVGVNNVAAVEVFAQDAHTNYPKTPLKAACYKELARRKMNLAHAKNAPTSQAPVPTSLASLKTGKRGN